MKVEEGMIAPNFVITDNQGIQKLLHQINGRKIVYFFPIAFGEESVKQAKSFQERYNRLKELDITEVVGISVDNEDKVNNFRQELGLDFILVSDKSKEISKSYGVYKNRIFVKYAERITFIIGSDNRIEKIYSNGFLNEDNGVYIESYAKPIEEEIGVSILTERLFSKLET